MSEYSEETGPVEYPVGTRVVTKYNPGGFKGTVVRVQTVMPGVVSFFDWPYKVLLDECGTVDGYAGNQLEPEVE